MPNPVWRLVWLTLLALIFGAFGLQARRDSYSCHLCRTRKLERTLSVWGVPLERSAVVEFPGNPEIAHRHEWWRYSYSYANGPHGVLRGGVACHTYRYKDGTNN